jgi:hypothetical protein
MRQFNELLGHKRAADVNSGQPMGYTESFNSTYDSQRSFAVNYKLSENVTLWHGTLVEKVLLDQRRA